mmetsp:Transcript_3292/g.4999  ORF Transcript_3292/g.4999 Transcript_3292/m.4999 type:complete len:263 (+) Transcript_3292:40-828(+)
MESRTKEKLLQRTLEVLGEAGSDRDTKFVGQAKDRLGVMVHVPSYSYGQFTQRYWCMEKDMESALRRRDMALYAVFGSNEKMALEHLPEQQSDFMRMMECVDSKTKAMSVISLRSYVLQFRLDGSLDKVVHPVLAIPGRSLPWDHHLKPVKGKVEVFVAASGLARKKLYIGKADSKEEGAHLRDLAYYVIHGPNGHLALHFPPPDDSDFMRMMQGSERDCVMEQRAEEDRQEGAEVQEEAMKEEGEGDDDTAKLKERAMTDC